MSYHGAECGECKHFALHRKANGRREKHYGQCLAPVTWPPVPICYGETWRPPERRPVWADSNAESCSQFAALLPEGDRK